MNEAIQQFAELLKTSRTILVLQPEKPDTDSLGSSLALEQILGDLGKTVVMYCQDPIPPYLRILSGWDRVSEDFPAKFDLSILVDTGGPQQLGRTLEKHSRALSAKPFVIIDHHATRESMPFPTINIIDGSAATGELLVKICQELGWPINQAGATSIVAAILADTLGLSTQTTTPETVDAFASMVHLGVNLAELRRRREQADALEPELVKLKASLLDRIEYFDEGRIAVVVVTPEELKKYAEIHDPANLVNQEMRTIKGVQVAAVLRHYASQLHGTKIKISMRANVGVAALAARHFGGGGHDLAAGCTASGRDVPEVKSELIKTLTSLLKSHETQRVETPSAAV